MTLATASSAGCSRSTEVLMQSTSSVTRLLEDYRFDAGPALGPLRNSVLCELTTAQHCFLTIETASAFGYLGANWWNDCSRVSMTLATASSAGCSRSTEFLMQSTSSVVRLLEDYCSDTGPALGLLRNSVICEPTAAQHCFLTTETALALG